MLKKSNDNLNTNDTNQIINILVDEVISTPRFFDLCKNEYQSSEIIEKLSNEAQNIAKQYLSNQNKWNDIIKKLTDDKNRIQNETNNTINELKAKINNLIEEKNKAPPRPPSPPKVNYFEATPYRGNSIVDGLKAIGECRTYPYREQIAARNGINGYVGNPQQNLHMLNLLIQGRLIKP